LAIDNGFKLRNSFIQMEKLLQYMYLFSELLPGELQEVYGLVNPLVYQPKEKVVIEGDKGDSFYVIQQGTVAVSFEHPNLGTQVVAQLKEGNFFGEIGALLGKPRTATVTATTESYLMEIDGGELYNLMESQSRIGYKVMLAMTKELAMREEKTSGELRETRIENSRLEKILSRTRK
jgi:CRP/FNR family transcriptional regulator, cyclic AMP receptor protein